MPPSLYGRVAIGVVVALVVFFVATHRPAPERQLLPAADKPRDEPRTLFVFGPESSGTRFIARALANASLPGAVWDGENPACWRHGALVVQHISLPWGSNCSKPMDYISRVNTCGEQKYGRIMPDIAETLRHFHSSRAVIITRDPGMTMRSVLRTHCSNRTRAELEHAAALLSIEKALAAPDLRGRVLHLQYEAFSAVPAYVWRQLKHFTGLEGPAPEFHSGNSF
ncbi:Hypothetical Protein FCC1311_060252 [Hondaea fermentalgiana]|uniref:Uncharacterized protein n=1 Tax=Hondaea fermentalgiana TaxID=2315210 RepID=A0A2R5GGS6_9STRA|nr:Hypothetical Protein FCC1311_060252 [Hondaea fermentalgiana]|eukprot:GBG29805.1 Hypothetical Protein FCC1311_060252 [Hondaea fermentalgiana]